MCVSVCVTDKKPRSGNQDESSVTSKKAAAYNCEETDTDLWYILILLFINK